VPRAAPSAEGWLARHRADIVPEDYAQLADSFDARADAVEADNGRPLVADTLGWLPEELRAPWRASGSTHTRRARDKRCRRSSSAQPGTHRGVQNQPDFQAARGPSHALRERGAALRARGDGRVRALTVACTTGAHLHVRRRRERGGGPWSVTDDAEAVAAHLRKQGKKVGVVSVKPAAAVPRGRAGGGAARKKASPCSSAPKTTDAHSFVTQALFKAVENANGERHPGIPAMQGLPKLTTAIFGLGAHDLQPRTSWRHSRTWRRRNARSCTWAASSSRRTRPPHSQRCQARLKAAYPRPSDGARAEPIRTCCPGGVPRPVHSIGGYGTIATGNYSPDILAGMLGMHSKAPPITVREEPVRPQYYITSELPSPPRLPTRHKLHLPRPALPTDRQYHITPKAP